VDDTSGGMLLILGYLGRQYKGWLKRRGICWCESSKGLLLLLQLDLDCGFIYVG